METYTSGQMTLTFPGLTKLQSQEALLSLAVQDMNFLMILRLLCTQYRSTQNISSEKLSLILSLFIHFIILILPHISLFWYPQQFQFCICVPVFKFRFVSLKKGTVFSSAHYRILSTQARGKRWRTFQKESSTFLRFL